MAREREYARTVPAGHRKSYGQYFTPVPVARFMCSWACADARTMLDPAVGNSIFFRCVREQNPSCSLTGYEIDQKILDYFGNPASAHILSEDYLLGDWNRKYDAIVCNPPYGRFQAVARREEVLGQFCLHTGRSFSRCTNLSVLFLIKSIFQLTEKGRLCYILPSEFMNSRYGTPVKKLLLEQKLLRAVINFPNDGEIFAGATTTCCLLLLDKAPKQEAAFYNLPSARDLDSLEMDSAQAVRISYEALRPEEKWPPYLRQEPFPACRHLRQLSDFCTVSRGIATGANDFFCFSLEKAQKFRIPECCLEKCICRSADVSGPFFTNQDFDRLSDTGKTVYLLNALRPELPAAEDYLRLGIKKGIDKKYLPSHRKPWFAIEQKSPAPIWVSSACRGRIKFVRNLAGIQSLTTFHSIYIHEKYQEDTDLIFCYFLTPAAQSILLQNRKLLGNGLNKFQPGDLNSARMLDISAVSQAHRARVREIYRQMLEKSSEKLTEELNQIFSGYLFS